MDEISKNNGERFLSLFSFSRSSRDPSELQLLTGLLAAYMMEGSSIVMEWEKKGRFLYVQKYEKRKTDKVDKNAKHNKENSERRSVNQISDPIIVLEDKEENERGEGLWVKMACPSCDVIASHSRELGSTLQVLFHFQPLSLHFHSLSTSPSTSLILLNPPTSSLILSYP